MTPENEGKKKKKIPIAHADVLIYGTDNAESREPYAFVSRDLSVYSHSEPSQPVICPFRGWARQKTPNALRSRVTKTKG